jgi:hypothetical protein
VSALEQPSTERRRRPPRRRAWPRLLALVVGVLLVFVCGVAFGMALRDDPEPGGTVTYVRTLEPLPQRPASTP